MRNAKWVEFKEQLAGCVVLLAVVIVGVRAGWLPAIVFWFGMVLISTRAVYDKTTRTHLHDRWDLIRTPFLRVFIHRVIQRDPGRFPHNHPWSRCGALILHGGYLEYRLRKNDTVLKPGRKISDSGAGDYHWFARGNWNNLGGSCFHRLEDVLENTWTLFVAGPRDRDWGFQTSEGFVEFSAWEKRCAARGGE